MSPLLLGIDIGTSSSKAVLTDTAGTIIASAATPPSARMAMPAANHAEMDPEAVWWADVIALCADLAARRPSKDLREVAGVAVSGIGPCFLPTDAAGTPLRPAILYGIDMRAEAEIAELTEHFGADEILRRCATALTSQAVGPKALWFRRREPELFARTRRWFTASSWIVHRLTGEYVIDHHTASQSVPFYDLQSQEWIHKWYEHILPGIEKPRLAWPTEQVGAITAQAAQLTGLPAGTPVTAGTVDAWAESFSCGVRAPGDLMAMYGSTMFFVQILSEIAPHEQLWNTAGVDVGTRCLAAGMSTSGTLIDWVRTTTGGRPFAELNEAAAQVAAGSDGLLLLPYFAGERTPIFDPDARGVITGLTLNHGPGHLLRAAYEGIAFAIRQILELFDGPGNPVQRVVAVGGGVQSELWLQIVSDVTGRPQEVPAVTMGACYGDALMAAIAAGLVAPETDWHTPSHVVTPNPQNTKVYDEIYPHFTALYADTRQTVHARVSQSRSPID